MKNENTHTPEKDCPESSSESNNPTKKRKLFSNKDDGTSNIFETVENEDECEGGEENKKPPQVKADEALEKILFEDLLPLMDLKDWTSLTSVNKTFRESSKKHKRRDILVFVDDNSGNNESGGKSHVAVIDRVGKKARHERLSAQYICEEGIVIRLYVNIMCGCPISPHENHRFVLVKCDDTEQPLFETIFKYAVESGSNLLKGLCSEYNVARDDFISKLMEESSENDPPRIKTREGRLLDYTALLDKMPDRQKEIEENKS